MNCWIPFDKGSQNVLIPIKSHCYPSQQCGLYAHPLSRVCVPPLHTLPGGEVGAPDLSVPQCFQQSASSTNAPPSCHIHIPECGSLGPAPCPVTVSWMQVLPAVCLAWTEAVWCCLGNFWQVQIRGFNHSQWWEDRSALCSPKTQK